MQGDEFQVHIDLLSQTPYCICSEERDGVRGSKGSQRIIQRRGAPPFFDEHLNLRRSWSRGCAPVSLLQFEYNFLLVLTTGFL